MRQSIQQALDFADVSFTAVWGGGGGSYVGVPWTPLQNEIVWGMYQLHGSILKRNVVSTVTVFLVHNCILPCHWLLFRRPWQPKLFWLLMVGGITPILWTYLCNLVYGGMHFILWLFLHSLLVAFYQYCLSKNNTVRFILWSSITKTNFDKDLSYYSVTFRNISSLTSPS